MKDRTEPSLTSSMRPCSRPMVSGRPPSLLLLALRTLRGKLERQAGREPSWFRLQHKRHALVNKD